MNAAIVTGAAQGIGKAISIKLMQQGIFVFVLDCDDEALKDFSDEVSFKNAFATMLCDVGELASLQETINTCISGNYPIKYLVNNAAIACNKPMEDLNFDEWNRVISVNLSSYFFTAKYLGGELRKSRGSIVNISSTRAFMSEQNTEAYSASKGGVVALTHALAMSLQPSVRVNCISPGWIDTEPWQKKSRRNQTHWPPEEHLQHPAGRIGMPDDVANLAWFLLSEEAGFITGQNFFCDGGMTRKMIYR